jgi:histone deacetylase complex regulatory component SIN3
MAEIIRQNNVTAEDEFPCHHCSRRTSKPMIFDNFNPQNDVSRAFRDDPSSLKYVMAVKTALNNTKKYDEFLKLLNVLRLRRNPSEYDEFLNRVKARVRKLFIGHTDFILGFNIFLPKEHKITLPLLQPQTIGG